MFLRKSNIIYKPVKQVLNFNSKVIGIIAIKTDDSSDFYIYTLLTIFVGFCNNALL